MKTYELKTIKDIFDKVPADRIEACLAELAPAMAHQKAIAESMIMAGVPAESITVWPEVATWVDDNKGELQTNIMLSDGDKEEKLGTIVSKL